MDEKTVLRFGKKVDRGGPIPKRAGLGPCWVWKAARNKKGYGYFGVNGKTQYAHRVAWMIANGSIPADSSHHGTMQVLHKCDGGDKGCVRPDHLHLGNHPLNMAEMVERERQPRGENHGNAKLTKPLAIEIRVKYAAGGVLQRALAAEYGVDRTTISRVVSGKLWGHIPMEVSS